MVLTTKDPIFGLRHFPVQVIRPAMGPLLHLKFGCVRIESCSDNGHDGPLELPQDNQDFGLVGINFFSKVRRAMR